MAELTNGAPAALPRDITRGPQQRSRVIEVDIERYQEMLDSRVLSDEQKRAFLEALWSVITAFIDLGYGVHPAQHADYLKIPDQGVREIADQFRREAA